jgi:hypothetical protein
MVRYPDGSPLGAQDPETWVAVAHPRLSFSLSRARETRDYVVNGIESYEGRLSNMRITAWPLFGAYCIYEYTIQDWQRQPGFKWTRFELLDGEGDLVRAHYLVPAPEDGTAVGGWFLFHRGARWALTGWRYDNANDPGKAFTEAKITYRRQRARDGVPVLAKVVYRLYHSGATQYEDVWSFTRVEPAEVPESAFTLPAFGLPDVAPEIDPRVRMRWIMLTGLAAIVVAAALAWARARRTRQPAAPA